MCSELLTSLADDIWRSIEGNCFELRNLALLMSKTLEDFVADELYRVLLKSSARLIRRKKEETFDPQWYQITEVSCS